MATATKTPRLLAAAKEFNIGKDTLVEFLTGKGFEINASNPNTKITEEMYDALQTEFAQDKLAKRKSEEIALPKGSLVEKKSKEEEIILPSVKKVEPAPAPVAEKQKEEPKEEAPTPEVPKAEPVEEKIPEAPVAEEKPVRVRSLLWFEA